MNAFFQVDTCRRRTNRQHSRVIESWGLFGWRLDHHCFELCTTTRSTWGAALHHLAEFSDSEFEGLSASVTYVDIHLIWQIWAIFRYCMLLPDYAFVIHLSDISQRSGLENRFDAIVTKTLVKNQFLHVSMIWSICKMPETFSDTKRRRGLLAGWGWWWDVYKIVCLHVFLSVHVSFFIVFSLHFWNILGLSSTAISQLTAWCVVIFDCEKMRNKRNLNTWSSLVT